MVSDQPSPRDLLVGGLLREFTLTSADEWILDTPGGSLLYAAGGYLSWVSDPTLGILARVGEDYPQFWMEKIASHAIDTQGVVVLPRSVDLRSCTILEGNQVQPLHNISSYFSRRQIALPAALIGYDPQKPRKSSRRKLPETAIRESDLPPAYQAATGAHFCPLDYLSHQLLPAMLRNKGFTTITLDPGSSYMVPDFFGDFPSLLPGLTAVLPSEEDLRSLYKGKTVDLWEIAEDLGSYGCELVVIKRGAAGQFLYESASGRKWEIPAYPSRVINPHGAGDAFCGGFFAGFRNSYDPLEAVLQGNVSASLTVEGHGPFFSLGALPGLAQARLEVLRAQVREV